MSGPRHSDSREPYRLEIEDSVWDALAALPQGMQEKVTAFWRDHLRITPHRPPIGGVKRLKGEWSQYYQFDVDRQRRMLYTVNDDERVVYVEFLGSHPEWEKRGRWR